MASRKSARRLGADLNLGGEQAEADPLLELAFFESADYRAIESRSEPRCFLIGRTGGGKSATLQHLEQVNEGRIIRITPEDLSLPYVTDLRVVRYLEELGVHLDLFFIALWKHVLLVEILRHRYRVDSPVAKQNFLTLLMERVKRDQAKKAAIEYLDEFSGTFWCETDERVREITEKFAATINAEISGRLGTDLAHLDGGRNQTDTIETATRRELAERFQRIVNETQLARLNKMMAVLNEDVLDSPQHFTYVVIDDLDRDWVDEKLANTLIRCLFRTVLDLKRVKNLKVLVALRTNIFEQLDFGLSGGQEEKFRSLILNVKWTPGELELLLDERTRVAADIAEMPPVEGIRDLLPKANKSRGNPVEFLMERTLLRPRDAIAFVNECLRTTSNKTKLSWEDLHAAERPYSENRLLALRDEWKPTYPGIDDMLRLFEGAANPMDRSEVSRALDDTALLMADGDFRGLTWLTELTLPIWSGGLDAGFAETYQPLLRLLYNIGFLGFSRSSRGTQPIYCSGDAAFADRISNIDQIQWFVIHPAFRAALDIRDRRTDGEVT